MNQLMIEEYGILLIQMMENAGRSLTKLVSIIAPISGKNVLVLAGTGNNSGGGLVAARHLSNMGAQVRVTLSGAAYIRTTLESNWASTDELVVARG